MNSKERFYPEAKFGGFTNIDGTMAFYCRIHSLLDSSSVALDVGCGRGELKDDPIPFRRNLRIIKGKVAKVIGIDVDQEAQTNPFIDEFHLIKGESWPLEGDSVDLIICDSVIEHIPDPDQFFLEICRVLKNGGYLCIRTPNQWGYPAIAAKLIPNKYHSKVTSFAQDDRKEEDVFLTFYRCNSIRRLRNAMARNRFDSAVFGYESEPAYLSFSKIAYSLGVLYQKLSPGFMKTTIFAFGKIKKDTV